MKILSEADFYKLQSSGLMYVVLEDIDFDGTYKGYLKAMGVSTYDNILTYEHYEMMHKLVEILQDYCGEGEKVIWRSAFRWRDSVGVLSGHFEGMSLLTLADDFGYEIVHDFHHIGVVRKK